MAIKKSAPVPPRPPKVRETIRSNEGLSFLKGKMRSTAKDKPLTAKEKAKGNKAGLKSANKPPRGTSQKGGRSTRGGVVGRGGRVSGIGGLGGGGMNWHNK